jgi:hypothetical protein
MEIQAVGKVLGAVVIAMLVITLGVVVAMLIFAGHDTTIPAHHVASVASSGHGHGHH